MTGRAESEDPLERLGEQLRRATDAAARLAREAARGAASAQHGTPPAGWQATAAGPAAEAAAGEGYEHVLATLVEAARGIVPFELAQRLVEAMRELLLALRALIDWYLERIEARRRAPVVVQDIPIS